MKIILSNRVTPKFNFNTQCIKCGSLKIYNSGFGQLWNFFEKPESVSYYYYCLDCRHNIYMEDIDHIHKMTGLIIKSGIYEDFL